MKRGTEREIGNRAVLGISRYTLTQATDTPLLQTLQINGFHNESMDGVEHSHPYGFTTVPKPPSQGTGQGGTGSQMQAAEAWVMHLGGNRSHGVAVSVSDRRYRPNNLQPGEVALHDDQGNQVYISRKNMVINAAQGVTVQVQTADGCFMFAGGGKVKIQQGTSSVTVKGNKTYLGSESASHAVATVDGPSSNVFATISETDTAMTAGAVAKRTQAQQSAGGTGGTGGGGS